MVYWPSTTVDDIGSLAVYPHSERSCTGIHVSVQDCNASTKEDQWNAICRGYQRVQWS